MGGESTTKQPYSVHCVSAQATTSPPNPEKNRNCYKLCLQQLRIHLVNVQLHKTRISSKKRDLSYDRNTPANVIVLRLKKNQNNLTF